MQVLKPSNLEWPHFLKKKKKKEKKIQSSIRTSVCNVAFLSINVWFSPANSSRQLPGKIHQKCTTTRFSRPEKIKEVTLATSRKFNYFQCYAGFKTSEFRKTPFIEKKEKKIQSSIHTSVCNVAFLSINVWFSPANSSRQLPGKIHQKCTTTRFSRPEKTKEVSPAGGLEKGNILFVAFQMCVGGGGGGGGGEDQKSLCYQRILGCTLNQIWNFYLKIIIRWDLLSPCHEHLRSYPLFGWLLR